MEPGFGIVKWFNQAQNYGFIKRPDGEDLFFHISNYSQVVVDSDGQKRFGEKIDAPQKPSEENSLAFEVVEGPKGLAANPWAFAEDWEKAESDSGAAREQAPPMPEPTIPKIVTVAADSIEETAPEPAAPEPAVASTDPEAASQQPRPPKPVAGRAHKLRGSSSKAGPEGKKPEGKPRRSEEAPEEPDLKSGSVEAVMRSAEEHARGLVETERREGEIPSPKPRPQPEPEGIFPQDVADGLKEFLQTGGRKVAPALEGKVKGDRDRPKVTRAESNDEAPGSDLSSNGNQKQLAGAHR